jgi:hypothetical protein
MQLADICMNFEVTNHRLEVSNDQLDLTVHEFDLTHGIVV